ncbi:hypothetical protein [Reinekea sp.]|jgi:hypothetical protein|uniref:hypothetical protein n=1 Tax=Reinekea sp. TaxID=1970455 RepID=UPI002A80A9CC|nr:hypothetical protein [Reinekea sp.]
MHPIDLKLLLTLLLASALPAYASADDVALSLDADLLLDAPTLGVQQTTRPTMPEAAMPAMFRTVAPAPKVEPVPAPPVADPTNLKVNVVEVTESFYKLVFDETTNLYRRTATSDARPGDLIELVITAVNQSDQTVEEVELINSVPAGPIQLIGDSFQWDPSTSLYRISRNGQTFFQADAELDPSDIHFIQWVIFSLEPTQSLQLAYRIQISR